MDVIRSTILIDNRIAPCMTRWVIIEETHFDHVTLSFYHDSRIKIGNECHGQEGRGYGRESHDEVDMIFDFANFTLSFLKIVRRSNLKLRTIRFCLVVYIETPRSRPGSVRFNVSMVLVEQQYHRNRIYFGGQYAKTIFNNKLTEYEYIPNFIPALNILLVHLRKIDLTVQTGPCSQCSYNKNLFLVILD